MLKLRDTLKNADGDELLVQYRVQTPVGAAWVAGCFFKRKLQIIVENCDVHPCIVAANLLNVRDSLDDPRPLEDFTIVHSEKNPKGYLLELSGGFSVETSGGFPLDLISLDDIEGIGALRDGQYVIRRHPVFSDIGKRVLPQCPAYAEGTIIDYLLDNFRNDHAGICYIFGKEVNSIKNSLSQGDLFAMIAGYERDQFGYSGLLIVGAETQSILRLQGISI